MKIDSVLRFVAAVLLAAVLAEVFANDGEAVLTERIYSSPESDGVEIYSASGRGKVSSLRIWKLASVWQ